MKRKKWSELEEQTLLSKYAELLNSGTLAKLKTREKKFKPIADHVTSAHHLRDPATFPFTWSWRDVSVKVQNMRHQYLGVKQKIRASDGAFNWPDGENHWENFLKYKEVFGDVELEVKGNTKSGDEDFFGFGLGLGFEIDSEDLEEDDCELSDGFGGERRAKKARRLGEVGEQVLELRDLVLRREERREREWRREEELWEREKERDLGKGKEERERGERGMEELELEERQAMWVRREVERRARLEREFDEERRWRMKLEERWEKVEMEWRERVVVLQIEHEKQMLQMHADACHNQMQILGAMARLVCQFFGSPNDGLGGGLAGLLPQVLQNLQHPGGLGDNGKPDGNSPSEFI